MFQLNLSIFFFKFRVEKLFKLSVLDQILKGLQRLGSVNSFPHLCSNKNDPGKFISAKKVI